jgi:predicted enzyme related to lactoylglutathione lyase
MAGEVVHFEVIGSDGKKLQMFFSEVFGWKINADNPIGYGQIDPADSGISGGIGQGIGGAGYATFYVRVDDLQAALDKAESLGGKTLLPPSEVSPGVSIAQMTDPEGHVIGLVKT